jgi:streptogramin lyase
VGANGTVWVIGTNAVPGGYGIYRRTNNTWVNVPGGAERIAVDPQGNAWVVNSSNTIFRHDGTQWVTVNGTARDIGIGANGHVWVIGVAAEAGGHVIYRSTDQGANWTKIPGSAVRVSVDPQGNAWVVNNANNIFRFDGSNWVHQPGTATDVGIGADGATWVIGADNGIYRFENNTWAKKPGGAAQIAAGPNGGVWVVNHGGEIYQAQTAAVAQAAAAPLNLPTGTIVIEGTTTIPVTGSTTVNTGPVVAVPGTTTSGTSGGLIVGGTALPGLTTQAPLVVTGSIDGYNPPGAVGVSQATCGVPGKSLCPDAAALLVGNADITCPSGSFPDLGRSACYSCPEGYTRSIHAVDNYKACQKPDSSITGGFRSATFHAPLCASGSFYDPIRGGECYKCDAGYNRSAAHIDATNACYVPIHEEFSSATRHKTTIWPHECSSGTFWDGYNGGACYSCPGGYARTAHHIANNNACAKWVGEAQARATLVKKAECGPGEIKDMYVQGTQNPAFGGGCWSCPQGTDRTILPITGASACEQAPGVQWASATRVRGMTCEPTEIYDPISSGNSAVASALAARNAGSSSPVTAKIIGGTCWTCPANHKRSIGAVYSGNACTGPDIVWAAAPYNQPGLFGLNGAEAVALKLVNERTTINTVIRDLEVAGNVPANFRQTAWDQIATRPQDSAVLALAVFSRVVAASTTPASATPEELALLEDVKKRIREHRVYMAQNALDAYRAWNAGKTYRTQNYAQSQLMVMTHTEPVPPDFELITAESIMGGLGAAVAANTAIYMTMSSAAVYKSLFPFAVRELTKQMALAATQAGLHVGSTCAWSWPSTSGFSSCHS